MKKKLSCPLCNKNMVRAFIDSRTYKERSVSGEIIEVVHVYYGCVNEECQTVVRLRYRKDGKEGDLFKTVRIRKQLAKVSITKPVVEDIEGKVEGLE